MQAKSKTYKESQATKTYIVLSLNGVCIGVFTNLRTAVETIREEDNCFPSYWTLIRKKARPLIMEYENDMYVFSEHRMNALEEVQPNLLTLLKNTMIDTSSESG